MFAGVFPEGPDDAFHESQHGFALFFAVGFSARVSPLNAKPVHAAHEIPGGFHPVFQALAANKNHRFAQGAGAIAQEHPLHRVVNIGFHTGGIHKISVQIQGILQADPGRGKIGIGRQLVDQGPELFLQALQAWIFARFAIPGGGENSHALKNNQVPGGSRPGFGKDLRDLFMAFFYTTNHLNIAADQHPKDSQQQNSGHCEPDGGQEIG
jgi:hypothetical protein